MEDAYEVDPAWLERIIHEKSEHPLYEFKADLCIHDSSDPDNDKELKAEFIKDMVTLANKALLEQERTFLIVGASNGLISGFSRDYDDSEFQNLVRSKITPRINFLYRQKQLGGETVGIFVILPRGDQIFVVKKDYKKSNNVILLKEGYTWIRKGTIKEEITENSDILALQKELDLKLYSKTGKKPLDDNKANQFWQIYGKHMKRWNRNLDFLGIDHLTEETPLPLSDLFMALHFAPDQSFLEKESMKEKIYSFLAKKQGEPLDIPATESNAKEEELEKIFISFFLEMRQLEDSVAQKKFYNEIIHGFRRVLIVGGPGYGKTTFARFLCLEASEKAFFSEVGENERYVPFVISLRRYEVFLREQKKARKKTSLLEFLASTLEMRDLLDGIDTEDIRFLLRNILQEGQALIILDGVDEISKSSSRLEILQLINEFLLRYEKCVIIITSRQMKQLSFLKELDFLSLIIRPLQDYEIRKFIHNWYSFREPDKVRIDEKTNKLISALDHNPNLLSLARNPLMLTIMTLIHRVEGRIPEKRTLLYSKIVTTFLETWDREKEIEIAFSMQLAKRSMGILGFETQKRFLEEQGSGISLSDTKKLLVAYLTEEEDSSYEDAIDNAETFLREFTRRSGVLLFQDDDIFFWHFTFREYFAAYYLFNQYPRDESLWQITEPLFVHSGWIPVLQLLFGMLKDLPLMNLNKSFKRILALQPQFPQTITLLLVEILDECPEISNRLKRQVANCVIELMDPPQGQEYLKFQALWLFERMSDFLDEEQIARIAALVLDDFKFLATPVQTGTGKIIQNPGIHLLNFIFNKNPASIINGIRECVPQTQISMDTLEEIEDLSSEQFSLLISMLECSEASNESLAKYHAFKTKSLVEILETDKIQSKRILAGQDQIPKEIFRAWNREFDPALLLYLHYLARTRNISNFFDLSQPSRPIAIFDEREESKFEEIANNAKTEEIEFIIEHNFAALQVDRKFRDFLQDFDYREEYTRFTDNRTGKELLTAGMRFPLQPFKSTQFSIDKAFLSGFYKHGPLSFRFRIQIPELDLHLSKKIEFSKKEEKKRFEYLIANLCKISSLFDLEIILKDEYTLSYQASQLVRQERYEEALELAERALILDSTFYGALRMKAEALGAMHKFAESSEICQELLTRYPNDNWIYHRLVLNFALQLDHESVLKTSEIAISRNIRDPHVLMYRADSLSILGRYEEAASLFQEVIIKLYNNDRFVIGYASHQARQGNIEEAIELLEIFHKGEPKNRVVMANLVQMNIRAENFDEAEVLLDRARKAGLGDYDSLRLEQILYTHQKRWSEALQTSERLLEISHEDADVWYNKACVESGLNRLKEAISSLKQAVELNPQCKEQAREDPDFANLRESSSFQKLVKD
ncbi:MAG: NACHT domain-containing protein [Candidatus Heimdallarchaeota archaeon]